MVNSSNSTGSLRALSFLAPGLPKTFFECVASHLEEQLGREIQLSFDEGSSGPMEGDPDPFAEGGADLGFLCSPSYLYLRDKPDPSVQLIPAGFVFRDSRNAGRAIYFSDVVVRRDHPALRFGELAGGTWGYNDECSLSGYFSTLQELNALGHGRDFFGEWVRTGSHARSIEMVTAGDLDGAAIDSVSLTLLLEGRPEMRDELRVIDSFGPFPIQPVVACANLDPQLVQALADAMLNMNEGTSDCMDAFAFEGCIRTSDGDYEVERQALLDLRSRVD